MLVDRRRTRQVMVLSSVTALFGAVCAASGLANYTMYLGTMPDELVLGSLGFDAISLGASVGMVACLYAIERGHEELWLPWTGLQAYVFSTISGS